MKISLYFLKSEKKKMIRMICQKIMFTLGKEIQHIYKCSPWRRKPNMRTNTKYYSRNFPEIKKKLYIERAPYITENINLE